MAGAMARGWASGDGGPEAMLFCDLDAARATALAEQTGGETRDSLPSLASDCDVVVLAVKPAALDDVAAELRGRAQAIVSMLAGVGTDALAGAFPDTPLLRLMPNQPVEVRMGVLCHPPARDMPADVEGELIEAARPARHARRDRRCGDRRGDGDHVVLARLPGDDRRGARRRG